MLGEIVSNGDAYQKRNISNFLRRGVRQLQLRSKVKYATSLGVHEGKMRRKVCSLLFLKARATREGGDSFRA
jgi:hypothetical protein